ncbi:6-hydroxymethylpterin diphosphokinase MptE-like protein [Psychromonas antarctica]|uniref:motility associated factor glycosyltransferase family protein n=1 Tax=Psychromonas antarctica TaxID=67573 RepID=UPI001EE922C8|nr:6-hydroxymethylpterin diphosphokinase MptE-like protein [Psychromonas antarctica]MCG6199797.1 DUF115 domain-containing protein [Psychromonas antarctica]
MTAQVDPLLDIQTKVLRATFINNMAVLKKYMPDVFKFYESYTPTRVKLTFDDKGHLNLVSNGNLIYQGDPKKLSDQQVAEFLEKPHNLTYHVAQDGSYNFEHEKVLVNICERRQKEAGFNNTAIFPKNEQIDFIAFMGTGLGYHLQSLFVTNDIRYAFVYEPDPDCFYCTLHSVDIGDMIKKCFSRGGQLTLQIGGNANGFVNEISRIFKRQGYFNLSKMFLYRHYLSEQTNEAFQMVHDLAYRYAGGWGFCEDEVIGISHTLSNIGIHKFPIILASAKEKSKDQPVFIIGNGPSLDESFTYLKTNKKKAIFISCGSALKPLLDNGIVPDIHIEMERTASLYDWVIKAGKKEQLQKIDLICLNTVYPEVLKLFKQAHLILKPEDAGSLFIRDYISKKYPEIYYCNPTVSNAATSSVVALGFKNLYLFGVDYGFKSEDHHHSKDSLYFTEQTNQDLDLGVIKGQLKVPGNFGGEVFATQTFDSSRMMLEMLLQANPDINCVNTSDGAMVELSTPCQINDLPDFKDFEDKSELVKRILLESFDNNDYSQTDLFEEFEKLLPKMQAYLNQLLDFSQNVRSRVELSEMFSAQYKFIEDCQQSKSKRLFSKFMRGSLNYLQANIMSNVYLYSEQTQQEEYIQFCLMTMNTHLKWSFEELKAHYNKPAKY